MRKRKTPIAFYGLKAVARGRGLDLWQRDGTYRVFHRDGRLALETTSLYEAKRFVTSHAAEAA